MTGSLLDWGNRANSDYLWVMKYLMIPFCKWMEKSWFNTGRYCLNLPASVSFKDLYLAWYFFFLSPLKQSTVLLCEGCHVPLQKLLHFNKRIKKKKGSFLQSVKIELTHWNQHELALPQEQNVAERASSFLLLQYLYQNEISLPQWPCGHFRGI